MRQNRELFYSKLYFLISAILILIFCLVRDYDMRSNFDAYNYLSGYNTLVESPFDYKAAAQFYGRYPEFIFTIFLSLLTFVGEITNVEYFITLVTFVLLFPLYFVFLNIHHLSGFKQVINFQGYMMQMIAAIMPLGLTVQTLRQFFSLMLLLCCFVLLRKLPYFRRLVPSFLLIFTHVSSIFVLLIHYLVATHRLKILFISVLCVLLALNFIIEYIGHIYTGSLIRLDSFSANDKYLLASILSLVFLQGKSIIFNIKFLIFIIICSFIWLTTSNGLMISRILYFNWFWVVLIGFSLLKLRDGKLIKLKMRILCASLISIKFFTIYSAF